MHCPKCGIIMLDEEFTCSNCGYLTDIAIAANMVEAKEFEKIIPYYAEFWRRLLALMLDMFFLIVGWLAFLGIIYGAINLVFLVGEKSIHISMLLPFIWGFGVILTMVTHWFYFTVSESSSLQATFGKRIMKVIVTDLKERRITLGRANLRYFCKIISMVLLFIGFIIAGFTSKRQALHDKIAGTVVLNYRKN
jgi:uncharacterized RDD family membrane protein YckC